MEVKESVNKIPSIQSPSSTRKNYVTPNVESATVENMKNLHIQILV